ncbi:MAG: class C sortase [Acutalibacteraceae bacterium]|nr:class C sortase [Clostridia bacterium]MEE3450432.1 class C sortase [Acutalibacteraceae bacterium]
MRKSKKKYNKTKSVVSIIGFLVCTALLVYPLVSDRWNKYRDEQIIERYIDEVNNGDPSFYENELQKASQYNEKLALLKKHMVTSLSRETSEEYESILDATGTGIMCYIEIPKIGLTEPVYHYSSDESLEKGIGHIHGSSLPIGGKNTFCILTGHRGLPSQKLFTDLDRMEKGDMFYIHILGHTLAYKVCEIKVVLPNDVGDLVLEEDRDIVTLVTCDPYGVNTHRMLVFGERTEFDETNVESGRVTTEQHKLVVDPALVILIGFIVFIIIMVITEISKTLGEKRRTVIDLEEETEELQEKPETVKRERHFSKPHPILYIKERLSQMSANKPQRRRKPVRYDYESFYYDDYDDYEYEYEIIRVKRRPRKRSHQKSRKKSFVLGLAMGLGIAGVIIIIYRFIKKRKERGTEDNEQ